MKDKRSTRARTSPLVFAPLSLGTIAVPAARPAKVPVSERVRGAPLSRNRTTQRAK
jgi:hypothetical protein